MNNYLKTFILIISTTFLHSNGSEPAYHPYETCPAIHQAAYAGDIAKLEELVKAGANVNDNSCFGLYTPLAITIDIDNQQTALATAKWLIEHGANVNDIGRGKSALFDAIYLQNIPLIELLCDKGANKEVTRLGVTPLMWATDLGYADVFNLLLAKGANPQTVNTTEAETIDLFGQKITRGGEHEKLIHVAVAGGNIDIIKTIIEKGFQKINDTDAYGNTPLHYVGKMSPFGNITDQTKQQIIEYLISKGANKNALNNKSETPYDVVVNNMKGFNPDIPEKWFDHIAWIKPLKPTIQRPAVTAAQKKRPLNFLAAIAAKEEIAKELAQCPPIHQAAYAGDIAKLEELVKGGADINTGGCIEALTPLGIVAMTARDDAEKARSVTTARWLIEHGANIEKVSTMTSGPGEPEASALLFAVMLNNAPLVALLCDKGANKEFKVGDGQTIIMLAIGLGYVDTFNVLLAKGANVQIAANDGTKAIHMAAGSCNLDILKTLIEKGLQKPNEKDNQGNTPLHYVVRRSSFSSPEQKLAVINYLTSKGPMIVRITNNEGKTAYDWALESAQSYNPDVPEKWIARIPWIRALRPPQDAAALVQKQIEEMKQKAPKGGK